MTLVARIAALSLLTSVLVAALGLAVLSAFVDPRVLRRDYVLPGLVLACVGGIIGAIAGTAREIVAARGAPQPQTTGSSTATKRRTPRVAAALALCFLCFVVVWFKARSSANDLPPPTIPQPTVKPGTASADSAKPAPAKPAADTKRPDAIQALMPSIVTVTRVEPAGGDVVTKPVSHSGIVVDPRGYIVNPFVPSQSSTVTVPPTAGVTVYIVTPFVPSQSRPKFFVVRFSNNQEFMGEAAAIDESLKLVVLKIESPRPLVAVPLAKIREARVGDKVLLVTSPASKEQFSGRVTSTSLVLDEDDSAKIIQTDITFPLSEYGSLMVSELGEPLGIFMASRTSPQPESIALPLKALLPLIKAAIDKPKDVHVVTVSPSPPPVDLGKPLQIGLQPATPLAKSLVELFAPRGAKILEYEEGKRLKIEAPPLVLEELGRLFKLVASESRKPEGKAEPVEPTASTIPADPKMPEIVGTWSRAESGTFSKLTIWPVENHVLRFFVEGADGNGLLEWVPAKSQFLGAFTFNVLGNRSVDAHLAMGPKGATRLYLKPADDQRKHLLRSGFAKTERELDKKLESDWTRAEAPVEPIPAPTVAVVKTEFDSSRIRESLRAKYREPPYRFFSNDTFRSVIVLAPAEAQEDLEALIHQLDVPEKPNQPAVSPNIAQQSPATQPQATDETKLFHLESSDATTMLGVVEKLFQGRVRRISADQRTNSLIVVAERDVCSEVEAIVLKLDSAPTQQRPAEANRFGAVPDTPAAKLLVEQHHAQESAAAVEAATIRQLQASGQAEQNQQPIAEHQRKLKNLLSTAFDLKLQLEELQMKELQSRLSRLERQIGQRKELREKIINRRAGELIEGDALRWDSTRDNAKPQGVTDTKSKDAAQGAQSIEPFVETTQIRFTGPQGMKVLLPGEPSELIAPGTHNFVRLTNEARRYDLGFAKAPGAPDRKFAALLDIFPSTPDTKEFLDHNAVPITLTDEDTRVASTELLIKVIYLHKPSGVKAAIPEVRNLLSTHSFVGGDVIAAVNGFGLGTILAVLRLAENADHLGKLDPKSSNAAITRPRLPSQEVANGGTAERSTSSPPSYQEFAKKLGTMNSSVAEAEEKLKRAEIRVKSGLELTEVVTNARRQVDDAIRNRKAIQDEYAAVLTDLKLQIESAQVEVDAAKNEVVRVDRSEGAGRRKALEDAELRLNQLTLALERLKLRYDLYKKAGEESPKSRGSVSNIKLIPIQFAPSKLAAEEKEKLIWEQLGLKFGKVLDPGLVPEPYRGGLTITEVEQNRFAPVAIQKGDILVGLHLWETTSIDGILQMLKNAQSMSVGAGVNFRVVALRDQNAIHTNVVFYSSHFKQASVPPKPMSLDELLLVLKDDRDTTHVIDALQQLGKLDLGNDAERVVTAILAAMEFFEPIPSSGIATSKAPPSGAAHEVLKTISRSAKTPAFVKTLRDGHPRGKVVAIWSFSNDPSLWEYAKEPDFPALAELLLAVAAGPDEYPRSAALDVLVKTLPITKIDLADLVTDERREAVRRLTTAIPRDRVLQLIVDAVSDEHIEAVLTAARLLVISAPEKLEDSELVTRLVDVLTKVIEGKLHDTTASTVQRGQALSHLSKLRDRAAPAVPMLIKLLKSGDLEVTNKENSNPRPGGDPRLSADDFLREKVIMTLGAIGPPAKDALPILEAELVLLDKQQKEDALLSGGEKSRPPEDDAIGSTPASRLRMTVRMTIGMIKGESRDSLFRRPNF